MGTDAAVPNASLLKEARNSLIERPNYAYIIYVGAQLAAKLKIDRVSVIEFGVAGGNGLVAMEQHAARAERELGVKIDVYGFDTGEGMLPAIDTRDMPHFFKTGNYRMDYDKLRAVLKDDTKLILGDATKTFPEFLRSRPAPIAAISYDMDHYHPTIRTLDELARPENQELALPRTPIYFDNTVGDHIKTYNEFAGELLAIADFNKTHEKEKIALCRDFLRLTKNQDWHHAIYFLHLFAHRLYDINITTHTPSSLKLKVAKAS